MVAVVEMCAGSASEVVRGAGDNSELGMKASQCFLHIGPAGVNVRSARSQHDLDHCRVSVDKISLALDGRC